MVAAMAVAPTTPIPGIVAGRLLSWLARCCAMIRFSSVPISLRRGLKLSCQHEQAGTSIYRQAFILFVRNDRRQCLDPLTSFRRRNAEFGQMRPQRIAMYGRSGAPLRAVDVGDWQTKQKYVIDFADCPRLLSGASNPPAAYLGVRGFLAAVLFYNAQCSEIP
jgi:hypothetical protein